MNGKELRSFSHFQILDSDLIFYDSGQNLKMTKTS